MSSLPSRSSRGSWERRRSELGPLHPWPCQLRVSTTEVEGPEKGCELLTRAASRFQVAPACQARTHEEEEQPSGNWQRGAGGGDAPCSDSKAPVLLPGAGGQAPDARRLSRAIPGCSEPSHHSPGATLPHSDPHLKEHFRKPRHSQCTGVTWFFTTPLEYTVCALQRPQARQSPTWALKMP